MVYNETQFADVYAGLVNIGRELIREAHDEGGAESSLVAALIDTSLFHIISIGSLTDVNGKLLEEDDAQVLDYHLSALEECQNQLRLFID